MTLKDIILGRRGDAYPPIDWHRDDVGDDMRDIVRKDAVLEKEEEIYSKLVKMGDKFPELVRCIDEVDKRVRRIEEDSTAIKERGERTEFKSIIHDEMEDLADRLYVDRRETIDVPQYRKEKKTGGGLWYRENSAPQLETAVLEKVVGVPAERKVYSEDAPVRYWRDITEAALGTEGDESIYTDDETKYKLENETVMTLIKSLRDCLRNRDTENAFLINNALLEKFGQYAKHKLKHDTEIDEGMRQLEGEIAELKQLVINKDNEIATLKETKILADMRVLELTTKLNLYEKELGYVTITKTPATAASQENAAPGLPVSDVKDYLRTEQQTSPGIKAVRIIRNENGDMVCSFFEGLQKANMTQERYNDVIEELTERMTAYLRREAIDAPSVLYRPVKARRKLVSLAHEDMNIPLILKPAIIEDLFDRSRIGKYIGDNRIPLPKDKIEEDAYAEEKEEATLEKEVVKEAFKKASVNPKKVVKIIKEKPEEDEEEETEEEEEDEEDE